MNRKLPIAQQKERVKSTRPFCLLKLKIIFFSKPLDYFELAARVWIASAIAVVTAASTAAAIATAIATAIAAADSAKAATAAHQEKNDNKYPAATTKTATTIVVKHNVFPPY